MADLSYTVFVGAEIEQAEIKDRWHLTGKKARDAMRILGEILGREPVVGDVLVDQSGSVRVDHIADTLRVSPETGGPAHG